MLARRLPRTRPPGRPTAPDHFGDLTKTAVGKIGSGVARFVSEADPQVLQDLRDDVKAFGTALRRLGRRKKPPPRSQKGKRPKGGRPRTEQLGPPRTEPEAEATVTVESKSTT